MLVYGKCECFVMQMLYVCVLCASCVSFPCCVLHDFPFVNAAFCMTFRLLMLVEDARGDHMEEAYSRAGLITCCGCLCCM